MTIDTLITDMQEVQAAHDALTITEVLRIFNIQALRDLTSQIQKLGVSK